ncbi:Met5p [Saccharomyces cerevisiae YJM1574]|uniref:Sulfite reductase [NADPH] subunit beta n=1 Tax=Saccharomyces cerevisiae TaxID=4932 RepID=E9P9H6_YEASX|nr:sulfite reductase beta subunit [Saccharomyces cerevisiae]AHY19016.1 Met5 protein [Saccharomyces cerevisiae]AJR75196.1 Met5p [Saccharomyces cerevisiae YJM1574]
MTASDLLTLPQLLAQYSSSAPQNKVFYTTSTKNSHSSFKGLESVATDATHLLNNQDPLNTIKDQLSKDILTTVFTDETTLVKSIHHLYSLPNKLPLVITVDLNLQDYSAIPALKDLSFPILISSDLQTAISNADSSYKIATSSLTPVFHFLNLEKIGTSTAIEQDIDFPTLEIANEETKVALSEATDSLTNFELVKGKESITTVIVNLSPYDAEFSSVLPSNVGLIKIRVYRPWNFSKFLEILPSSVTKIAVLQGVSKKSQSNEFQPFLLDFFGNFNELVSRNIEQVLTNIGNVNDYGNVINTVISNINKKEPDNNLFLGESNEKAEEQAEVTQLISSVKKVVNLEDAYIKVLKQLFSSNLQILNQFSSETIEPSNPEFGFGRFLKQEAQREELISLAKTSLDPSLYLSEDANKIVQLLSKWLSFNGRDLDEAQLQEANATGLEIFQLLQSNQDSSTVLKFLKIAPTSDSFIFKSSWLIGSDAWSYDLGHSGIQQVLSSRKNINVLLIDSEPYDHRKQNQDRKKDVGLYAMNYYSAYVASVAVYASYTQLLTAIIEASKYNGPSIVLAYLPYNSENDTPLEVLKETKNAVESGYWPLYRFNPVYDDPSTDKEAFSLDSSVIRKQLQDFLDRENKLTLLTRKDPSLSRNLKQSAGDALTRKQEKRSKAAFDQLLEGLSGPPLHVYYASDGGNAANLAKRLAARASARGLKATVLSMDDIILEELPGEENVVFITSTAGQGEFPQDGKSFWEALKNDTDLDLASLNVAVFGLGDSEYWPRKEDKHYFNKPSQDLFKRLELLSAKALIPLGLGDDQDADGFQTAYSEWEPKLWEALGVSGAAVDDEPKPVTNEDIKRESNFLRGTISENLKDTSSGGVTHANEQLMKFHGIYTQDDRDIREIRKSQGLEPYYMFMARARLPGGKTTPQQWLALDHLSDTSGNGTLKLTTRATFQIHGVLKKNLKHTLRGMNAVLMDTLAAAGDVNRNVMVSALPTNAKVHQQIADMGKLISDHFLPKTTAYHEVWLEGPEEQDDDPSWPSIFENRKDGPRKKKTLVSGNALVDIEPIYGPTYLPRKFKFNIAVPPYNDVDVLSIDVGLVAIVNPETQIVEGYNVFVGGGMGTTHNNKKTYPRLGSCLGFVKTEDIIPPLEGIVIVQRDHGDRKDRKHARLKYTVDDMGVEGFKQKVEEYWGKKFEPERPFEFKSNIDYFGWIKDETGLNHFTAFIENGRVEDTPDLPQKTGIRKVAEYMLKTNSGHFRLTGNQHLVISNITDEHVAGIKSILKTYKLDNTDFSGLRLSSSSCVGLPTCGLAFAESERFLPDIITQLEDCLEEYGLRHDSIIMRMTGCPNGCSRPWLGELALVGKAPHTYNLMLGGGYLGQRLNKLYKANVKDEEIVDYIKPLFKRYALEREEGEHFGDFCIRVGIIKPTTEGKYFHEDVSEDAY